MRISKAAITLIALSATLVACGPQRPRGPSTAVIDRALAGAPGEAQPSTIVSTEIAFARAAREKGQWTAFAEYAAPGALIHGAGGAIVAETWLPTQSNPDEAVQWAVRTVLMSCDGGLAISQGRFRDPQEIVGNYVTVWERQPNRTYRYVYDVGGPDVPQPPPRERFEDGDIVVTAIDAVQGLIATCPRGGETIPAPPADSAVAARPADVRQSRDGTLRWRFEHRGEGEKYVVAEYYYLGEWVTAIEESLAPSP